MTDSVPFDRAVSYYDDTRSLSPDTLAQLVRVLSAEVSPAPPTLEVGIGSGRLAIPLRRAGVEIFGIDLAPAMVARLREKDRDVGSRALVADATALPFDSGTFGSALVVHVFHLIPSWGDAVDELVRVVRAEGAVIADIGTWGAGRWRDIQRWFADASGVQLRHPGAQTWSEIDSAFARHGARGVPLEPVVERKSASYADLIQSLEDGIWSWTWRIDDAARRRAAEEVRRRIASELGSLEQTVHVSHPIAPRLYRLP